MALSPDTPTPASDELAHGRFLRLTEVMASVGLGRTMIYALMKRSDDPFPTPIKIGQASLWLEPEVRAWKGRRIADRGGS